MLGVRFAAAVAGLGSCSLGEPQLTGWRRAASRFEIIQSVRYHDNRTIIRDRAGFVRLDEGTIKPKEYYIFPETFRNEVCNGHSWQAVLKELDARGYLRRQPPDMTMKPNLPGAGRPRAFTAFEHHS